MLLLTGILNINLREPATQSYIPTIRQKSSKEMVVLKMSLIDSECSWVICGPANILLDALRLSWNIEFAVKYGHTCFEG